MQRELVGHVLVDSGQIFITDPCYLSSWRDGDYVDGKEPDNSYARVTAFMLEDGPGEVHGGVVVPTDGDHMYPVYVNFDEQGRVLKIEIMLDDVPWR